MLTLTRMHLLQWPQLHCNINVSNQFRKSSIFDTEQLWHSAFFKIILNRWLVDEFLSLISATAN